MSSRQIKNQSQFIEKLSQRHTLYYEKEYVLDGTQIALFMTLEQNQWHKNFQGCEIQPHYKYLLGIKEGDSRDKYLETCTIRDAKIEFVNDDALINYIINFEKIKLTDWTFSKDNCPKFSKK